MARRVVPGWPHKRKSARLRRLDRRPGSQERALPAGLRRDRVRVVEPGRLVQALQDIQILGGVDTFDGGSIRGLRSARVGERVEKDREAFGSLGIAERRVQARERGVRQDVDRRTAAAGPSSPRVP